MDCCFVNECERFAVTPVLVSPQVKCCESAPIYVPCCNDKVVYCCEKIRPCTPVARKICYDGNCDHTCTLCSEPPQKFCPTCRQPTGPPAKPAVKYVMPCYRYEDGRIINQPTCLTKHACKVACSYCPTQRPPSMPVQCLPCEPRKLTYVQRCRVPENCCTACLGVEE
ncbi:PREDICTED: keratin-associated protein 10-5-like isoform X2 [Papilio xuthus]|uniref:Keratin-associated protein 10-5-like isoform X2 n=1 Tax=Papilio xuthus TaxID=66420 RepID=A0AAJ6ZQ63_PAPXU|nr:PREDICTED: keratin-associated protein 10-5-like isoform X2 [Papilio xuthus]